MKDILDFTHTAISKITSGHTIMSGIHENPISRGGNLKIDVI